MANILADVIIDLAEPMLAHIKPGGLFICSGIILERAPDVERAVTALGYTLAEALHRGEWIAYAWRAPEAP